METITSVASTIWTEFGTAFTQAESHPVMFIPLAFGIVGGAIGLFRRATKIGGRRK